MIRKTLDFQAFLLDWPTEEPPSKSFLARSIIAHELPESQF